MFSKPTSLRCCTHLDIFSTTGNKNLFPQTASEGKSESGAHHTLRMRPGGGEYTIPLSFLSAFVIGRSRIPQATRHTSGCPPGYARAIMFKSPFHSRGSQLAVMENSSASMQLHVVQAIIDKIANKCSLTVGRGTLLSCEVVAIGRRSKINMRPMGNFSSRAVLDMVFMLIGAESPSLQSIVQIEEERVTTSWRGQQMGHDVVDSNIVR